MDNIREVIARAIDPFMPRYQQADAVLSAIEAAGMVIVPSEPTEAMIAAGWIDKEDVNPDDIYRAMLAATPQGRE